MSSSEDNSSTGLPSIIQATDQFELQPVDSSNSSSEENEKKKKESWLCMVQAEHNGDFVYDLRNRFNRNKCIYKDFNSIYVSKIDIWLKYNLKRKEIKQPATAFAIFTKNFRLFFSQKDEKVIYTDGKGTYLSHYDLHLRRAITQWITLDVLLLSFVYAHKKHAAIEFQIILEAKPDHFYVRSKQVLIHYEELNLPKLLSKTAYPARIRNWYLFFE